MISNICFRDFNHKIPTTTHSVFSLYRYPAKFIPQIISYILENPKYVKKDQKLNILDPFAGCGTTGLVARLYGHDCQLPRTKVRGLQRSIQQDAKE